MVDLPAPSDLPAPTGRRWLARLAFLTAAAAVILMLAGAGVRASIGLLLVAAAGMAVMLAAAWWFLTHRGWLRWVAAVVAVAAPVTVLIVYARASLFWVVVVFALLWAGMVVAARAALRHSHHGGPVEYATPPPARPFLIMNPKSGGGKVVRFDLEQRARKLGAQVYLLDGPNVDVAEVARQAVRDGADLLGVAGGDGTQALVAAVAAEAGLPFLVISAGTRNHFALDLGLDREDPSTCLEALGNGVEIRADLGRVGDRVFVNNASFGAYAAIVQSPAYRDDKAGVTLDLLPDLLTGHQGPVLRVQVGDDLAMMGPQAVLVSNNPYGLDDVAGLGRRYRLDGGDLGVLAVHVRGAADAASLVFGGRPGTITRTAAKFVSIDADVERLPVGVDGEALLLPTPVRCSITPGALRVRVPRDRPGVPPPPPELDWSRLRHLALTRR
ncbi:diacylglycerol kinase family protein [Actinoplanes sp. KI2]|uniref:diacylglycerol/lipid kinase family protein n=1 Tax=Actinoplanes sp. KI2 TaxID=2983315 RepID=UPI0021D5E5D5|nr:diacylglycerol kinase family protein [Actinoplanes sp. KI2]MCU7727688.1 diacylglycerol kinase family protein [Actinoplanes sp. KI2]